MDNIILILSAVIGSGALSAVISGLFARSAAKQKEKDSTHDGVKLLMESDIRTRCENCISRGSVTTDELSMLHRMWHHYHDKMGGNGFLDHLMSACAKLEIKDTEETQ